MIYFGFLSSQTEDLISKICPVGITLAGTMEDTIVRGWKQPCHSSCQFCSTGRSSQLILYNAYLVMCLRQLQHCLYKIVAIAVEPCSTDDEELFCKLLNKFLTGKLGHTISTLRIRSIELGVRSGSISIKYIICGNVHHLGTGLSCRNT